MKFQHFQHSSRPTCRRSPVSVSKRSMLLALALTASATADVVVLHPGQFKDDFEFTGAVVNNSLTALEQTVLGFTFPAVALNNPSIYGYSRVSFMNLDNDPTITFGAFANNITPYLNLERKVQAFARGKVSVDFCVPSDGQATPGVEDGETIASTVQFTVSRVGRLSTYLPGSSAYFGVSVRIWDYHDGRAVYFNTIESTTVGNLLGGFKMIKGVPVPVPQSEGATLAVPQTFVVQLRRGRSYRFELFAAGNATAGRYAGPPLPVVTVRPKALCNFEDVFPVGADDYRGVKLIDFSMDVSTDTSTEIGQLLATVESLQNTVSELANQVENMKAEMDDRVTELDQVDAGFEQRISELENLPGIRQRLGKFQLPAEPEP